MDTAIEQWMNESGYMPEELRDFHNQKDLFKAIYRAIDIESHECCSEITWIQAHVFTVDIFLWWMAKRGYTLQKSRKKLPFRDLWADITQLSNRTQVSNEAKPNDHKPKDISSAYDTISKDELHMEHK